MYTGGDTLSTGEDVNNSQALIAAVQTAHPTLSQNRIAELLKLKKQTVSNWTTGNRQIENLTTVAEVCIAAGLPPAEWVARFGEQFATTKKAADWWKHVAKVAAVVLAVYMATPSAIAAQDSNFTIASPDRHCARFGNYSPR